MRCFFEKAPYVRSRYETKNLAFITPWIQLFSLKNLTNILVVAYVDIINYQVSALRRISLINVHFKIKQ